jgi:hypothetical protein
MIVILILSLIGNCIGLSYFSYRMIVKMGDINTHPLWILPASCSIVFTLMLVVFTIQVISMATKQLGGF